MTLQVQRWRERRDAYRPAGEPIDAGRYGVEPLAEIEGSDDPEAAALRICRDQPMRGRWAC